MKPSLPKRQRGTTLLEALIAFIVLSVGMLAAARVQTYLRQNAELTRQRAEAVRFGQQVLEQLRAFAVIPTTPNLAAYDDIASATTTAGADGSDATTTRYTIERRIDAHTLAHAKAASVTVGWAGSDGSAQQIVLHSIIAEANPATAGALAVAPGAKTAKGAFGRSVQIPLAAKDLGDGRSALKPVEGGSVALVFANASGLVVGRCSGVNPAVATRHLGAADLTGCGSASGYLLSGIVRFSADAAPNPAAANAAPLPLALNLTLSGGTYPLAPACDSEAQMTVSYADAGGLRIDAVPVSATPASRGLAAWTDTGERHVAYHCVVYPLGSGQWSGRLTIAPIGWSIGTGATDRRVCRYSADLDASGAIDGNLEHPAIYTGVDSSMSNQNFLVINGSASCPGASAVRIEGNAGDVFANLGTMAHQP